MATNTTLIGLKEIAEMLGVKHTSANVYHQVAKRNRRAGKPRKVDMPEPDVILGRTPAWKRSTIERWITRRG